jgi:hypothetical protein
MHLPEHPVSGEVQTFARTPRTFVSPNLLNAHLLISIQHFG